jgi:hypothetical protein
MGARGPAPKRSDHRRRRNAPATPVDQVDGAAFVEQPDANPEWHPVAARWYAALAESGQSVYYEPSDWATAFLMAESISRDLMPQFVGFRTTGRDETEAEYAAIPLKGASLSAYLKAMTDLLVTEGARRRASVELQRPDVETPTAENVIDYRARAAARG